MLAHSMISLKNRFAARCQVPSIIVILITSFFASTANADNCKLTVGDRLIAEGKCDVRNIENENFYIAFKEEYIFLYLLKDSKTQWRGYWNESENHAHTSIGDLIILGNCWSSDLAEICVDTN